MFHNSSRKPSTTQIVEGDTAGHNYLKSLRTRFLGVQFDLLDPQTVIDLVKRRTIADDFNYVVTPNIDHIVRLDANPAMLEQYEQAMLCLCDSKPVQMLSRPIGRSLTHVTGSDLTKAIFNGVLVRGDRVTLVVANDTVASKLSGLFPDVAFEWHVPPFGIMQNPQALQDAVDFIVGHPARFCFIAIGSPQSEVIAFKAKANGAAKGTAFCIGASLEFLTGDRRRAPAWMNRSGIEWVHRIATDRKRLWRRYVYAVPPFLKLYWRELTGRASR